MSLNKCNGLSKISKFCITCCLNQIKNFLILNLINTVLFLYISGVLYRVDFSKVNVFGNDFANSVNSDLDDADWSLGDSSVAFENSPPEHGYFST